MKKLIVWVVFSFAVAGCANPYQSFYEAAQIPPPPTAQRINFIGEPRVITSSGNLPDDIKMLFEDGYGLAGSSNFVGPAQNQVGAVAQAKKLGAAIVVIGSKYQSTATGAIPLVTTTPQTTYTNGNVTAYGSGGAAYGSYSGTSTTYAQQTTMIPYAVDRYDQVAVYFKPMERKGFGAVFGPISDEQRQQIGTNKGLVVKAIRKGSPAFGADLLPGDIVLSVNDNPIFDDESAGVALVAARGGFANLEIVRSGQRFKKSVSVPIGEW